MSTTKFKANLEKQIEGTSTQGNTLLTARAVYNFATDAGAQATIVPKITASLPKGAVIVGGTVNSILAFTSNGSATLAIGTSAGSSTTSILGATAKATLSINALVNSAATFAAPVKLSAAGNITFTIATADATAGLVEVVVLYYVATA